MNGLEEWKNACSLLDKINQNNNEDCVDAEISQLDKDIVCMEQLIAQFDDPFFDRLIVLGDRDPSLAFEHLKHFENVFMINGDCKQKPWIETDEKHGYKIFWLIHAPDLKERSVYQTKLETMKKRRDTLLSRCQIPGDHIYFDNHIHDFSCLEKESKHLYQVIKEKFPAAKFSDVGVLVGVDLFLLNKTIYSAFDQLEPVLKKLKQPHLHFENNK